MDKNKDFYDLSELDNIDAEITSYVNRPTLVDGMKKQNEKKKDENKSGLSWAEEWRRYWYVYLFLAVSGLFTGTLGLYMGLSPTLVTEASGAQYIHFNTDAGHILLALVYMIAFVCVTEVAFAVAKWKFFTREENNQTQKNTMITAMAVALLSVLFTGIAGGMVVASNIAFLDEFVNIPPAAQKWVVVAIPVLLVIYTILYSAYALSSATAAAERIINEQARARELDHKTRQGAIRQMAAERFEAAQILLFQDQVMKGKMSHSEAMSALEAGRSLMEEEVHLGRDLDDDNQIGAKTREQPPSQHPSYRPAAIRSERAPRRKNTDTPRLISPEQLYIRAEKYLQTDHTEFVEAMTPYYLVDNSQLATARSILRDMYPGDDEFYYTVPFYEKDFLEESYRARGVPLDVAELPFSMDGMVDHPSGLPNESRWNAEPVANSRSNGRKPDPTHPSR